MLLRLFLLSLLFVPHILSELSQLSLDNSVFAVPSITTDVTISSYLWPFPTQINCTDNAYIILNNQVNFVFIDSNSFPNAYPIITQAFSDYNYIIRNLTKSIPDGYLGVEGIQLSVTLVSDDVSLTFDTIEDYNLIINYPVSSLTAASVYGALRGLETFSQLMLVYDNDQLFLHECYIVDAPFFKHRGLLLDTSRHYLPVGLLKKQLDVMAWNKFNVFHWHIVDMQAFPYVSEAFPELSAKGAFSPRHTYNSSQLQEVIDHAKNRGIRVMVEFDTPGHTDSWGKGQANLLTSCYSNGLPDGTYGPINAISNVTWPFLETLFKEIVGIFKDNYLHLGGDEVKFDC